MKKSEKNNITKKRRLISALLLFAMIFTLITTLASCGDDDERFDFIGEDLSKYVSISEEDYKGYTVTVDIKEPGTLELEERILQTLVAYKSDTPEYMGNYMTVYPIEPGSVVKIRYRGYTLDENGNQIDVAGTSNFTETTDTELEIGSGKFVSGIEYSLIGKNMSDYSTISFKRNGAVSEGDVVIASFSYSLPNGRTYNETSVRIDTSDSLFEERYGQGFIENLIGKEVGGEKFDFLTSYPEGGDAIFVNMDIHAIVSPTLTLKEGSFVRGETVKVKYNTIDTEGKIREQNLTVLVSDNHTENYGDAIGTLLNQLSNGGEIGDSFPLEVTADTGTVYSGLSVVGKQVKEDKPITVTAYFPYDYDEESLRNKEIYFDIYVSGVQFYETPSLTEDFIKETLKISDEELNEYEGAGAVEKYRALVASSLKEEYEEAVDILAEEKLFEYLVSVAKYKKLPEKELEIVKDNYYADAESYYEMYPDSFASPEEAGALLYDLDSAQEFRDYVESIAERDVKERLVFYYIGKKEKLFPSKDEVERRYKEEEESIFAEYLDEVKCKRENYSSDAAYEEAKEYYREEMLTYYLTPEMIYESIYYSEGMPKMLAMITIKVEYN